MRSLRRILDDLELISSVGHALQAKYFDGRRRAPAFDWPSAVVKHCANAAKDLPGDKRIANLQGALLHEQCGNRATPTIELRFKHDAVRQTNGIRLQLQQV